MAEEQKNNTAPKNKGGRPKGSTNKRTELERKLKRLGVDPIEGMALLAKGSIDCTICTEGLVDKWVTINHEVKLVSRPCPVCDGTSKVYATRSQRTEILKELGQYVQPKRKATEHTGQDGGPLVIKWADE